MRQTTLDDYRKRILDVLIHIQRHLDEDVSLEALARVAHFAPHHFHRVFRGMVGESVKEHVRRLRLERAAYFLRYSDRPVTRLAFEAGYETHESFTRAFRAHFGESPSGYRRRRRHPFASEPPSRVHYSPEGDLDDFTPTDTGATAMNVELKRIEPIRVAFMRHTGPYKECGIAWEKLCGWIGRKGLFRPDTRFLGVSYDDPDVTPPEKLRYDACVVVGPDVKPEGEIGVQKIAGGLYAVTIHKGPYEKFSETYAKLMGEWLPRSGHRLSGTPCFEHYLNDPNTTPREELLTAIHVPLESD